MFSDKIDLLQIIPIPLPDTINFITGYDSYPAFHLNSDANLRTSAAQVLSELYSDFALLATVKPSELIRESWLFAFVSPLGVVQFGLSLAPGRGDNVRIILYYTDPNTHRSSIELAQFTVQDFVGRWTRFAIAASGENITLYFDCQESQTLNRPRYPDLILFEDGSTYYLGQQGQVHNKYVVRLK